MYSFRPLRNIQGKYYNRRYFRPWKKIDFTADNNNNNNNNTSNSKESLEKKSSPSTPSSGKKRIVNNTDSHQPRFEKTDKYIVGKKNSSQVNETKDVILQQLQQYQNKLNQQQQQQQQQQEEEWEDVENGENEVGESKVVPINDEEINMFGDRKYSKEQLPYDFEEKDVDYSDLLKKLMNNVEVEGTQIDTVGEYPEYYDSDEEESLKRIVENQTKEEEEDDNDKVEYEYDEKKRNYEEDGVDFSHIMKGKNFKKMNKPLPKRTSTIPSYSSNDVTLMGGITSEMVESILFQLDQTNNKQENNNRNDMEEEIKYFSVKYNVNEKKLKNVFKYYSIAHEVPKVI